MRSNTAWYRSAMPEHCLEMLVNHAKTPSDFVATWSMIAREPFEIAGPNGDQLLRGLPQNTSRKLLRLYTDRLRFLPV
jgi:hypothetical protein